MRFHKYINYLLVTSLFMNLSACKETNNSKENANETIALIEPVNAASTSEAAAYRNLYNATIYSSYVLPATYEFSFAKDTVFDHYGVYPGQNISSGGALIVSNTKDLDKQIEDIDDTLDALQESYDKFELNIDDQISEKLYYSDQYVKKFGKDNIDAELMCADVWSLRLQKEQRQELLTLDQEYYTSLKTSLQNELIHNSLLSDISGTVVSIAPFAQGDKITRDVSVVSVGDMNDLQLRCDYINRSTVSKAKEYFAIIDGIRYDISYQPVDPDEYSRLTSKGETVYSTFTFTGDTSNVSVGDYAALVFINDARYDCLSVPNSSIHKDESGTYVYIMEDNTPVYRSIKTGLGDGVYTEVVDGISFGEQVMTDTCLEHSLETVTLSRGDFYTEFSSIGEAYYPSQTLVKNEVEYGTVYFISYEAELFTHVNKGDTIATICVSPDSIILNRKNVELQRLKERSDDLDSEWKKLCDKAYEIGEEDEIAYHEVQHSLTLNRQSKEDMNSQIEDLSKEIAEIEASYNTTKIVAPKGGIITNLLQLEDHDIIPKDSVLCIIADENSCFIRVDNTNQLLNCGNEVNITYSDPDKNSHSVTGRVVTIANLGTTNDLDSETVLVQIPAEAVSEVTAALILPVGFEADYNASWFDEWRKMFKVKATVRNMEQVLTVPKNAVYEISGKTYVYVKKPDGSIVFTSFISGGHDTANYWIIDGLEEGSEICLK